MDSYPAKYTDAHGTELTTIFNDGDTLRMCVRGVEFRGDDFDMLEPPPEATKDQLRQFVLCQNSLCSCQIECQIPIPIHNSEKLTAGTLFVKLNLGEPAANQGLDREVLHLELVYPGHHYASSARSGWFEDELLDIQSQLPANVFMKACINCLYSDYSPVGHGLFGGMMCFRNLKAEYRKVRGKDEFWSVHGRHDRSVQETYLCPEFEQRILGTGYRG